MMGCGEKRSDEAANTADEAGQISVTENAFEARAPEPLASYDISGNRRTTFAGDADADLLRQLTAISNVRNSYAKVSKELLAKRLSREYFLRCSSCHDDYANGVIGPSLLDKDGAEIFKMIKAYQHKDEKNVLMEYLVSQMSDDEIRALADEIAKFNEDVRRLKHDNG
jgi:Glu-tRNA(Gln) amidotransferase subunit E-like FAD-binding protein